MKIYHLSILLIISISCSTSKNNNHIYWINSVKVPCTGVGSKHCYLAQKGDTLSWENWQNFYSSIDGFEFEPGYIYKLIVNEKKLDFENVPTDASSIKYTLVKIIEKKADNRLKLNQVWFLVNIQGDKIQFNKTNTDTKVPQIEFKVAEMSVNGNDGCNNFFGGIKILTFDSIEFNPFASTKMACLDTDIPDRFNIALGKTSMYKIEGLRLILYDAPGNEILIFKNTDE